jgi:hypothetical protein
MQQAPTFELEKSFDQINLKLGLRRGNTSGSRPTWERTRYGRRSHPSKAPRSGQAASNLVKSNYRGDHRGTGTGNPSV